MRNNTLRLKPRRPPTDLEGAIGYTFKDHGLLLLALTHSSHLNESGETADSNERLEFLGDAVIELVVSDELYRRFPEEREGELTRLRARLVKEQSLAELARGIGLPDYIMLGRGEEAQGGRERDSLLADALEAVIGAVYLDGGFEAVVRCSHALLSGKWPESPDAPKVKDFKTRLQELTQQRYKARPEYAPAGMHGPDHAKVYVVAVRLPDGREFRAEGASKKKAEQRAADLALQTLEAEAAASPGPSAPES
ncbi:Ribonuclease 3 [Desulfovibrio sp. X2]|uniref:ribonuclease III n=1 Tax=Desulfovibrio sp. X2 TaxID=941449 RepID=UPI00035899A3|nr:ribonuclease III [Desulfovibrio sp. X2]EPR43883.1 Ribonuclease 3 [Desulfovibrio sp. X2]